MGSAPFISPRLRYSPRLGPVSGARASHADASTGLDGVSDEDLMLRVAQGDEIAFRQLMHRHGGMTFSLARRIAADDDDAEEIVQEAMLRVWTNAPRWRPVAAFRTWLYRVVVNLCLNRRRRQRFAPLDEAGDPADPAPGATEQIEQNEADRLVAQAIAELPERQRAAIVLTYHAGLCNAETAAILDTSVSSVEALLVRAKRTLRMKLGALDGAV